MEAKRICPGCQKPVPPDVSWVLCPECLLKSGFETGTEPGATGEGFLPPAPAEIAQLFPQFEIIGLIGQGGMGAVYQARQKALDRFVALKILPQRAAAAPGFAERFNREARALARLNHPNIVAVHDFGKAGELHYLVMEYVQGMNLRQCQRAGKLRPEQALQIVPQICDALQFAHNEGVVHRDIKPENILLDTKGRVKITDFGIAKIVGAVPEKVGLTEMKDIMGTPHYMAPEQVENPQAVDHRADIFSLGVVFYELLTGELPLGKFALPSHKVEVDVRLDEVVLHALEKEPERRYQQANALKKDLETIAGGGTPPPLPDFARHRRTATVAMVVTVTALIAVATSLFLARERVGWFQRNGAESRHGPASTNAASVRATDKLQPSRLRYHWKEGESYAYSVQIEAAEADYTETVTGTVIYEVRAVEDEKATLTCRSHMSSPQRHVKPGKMLQASMPFEVRHFWTGTPMDDLTRTVRVDSTGRILEQTGPNHRLPQVMGGVERLVFEPLPPSGDSAWETEGDCTLVLDTFAPVSPMSRFGRTEQTTLPAREKASYRVGSSSSGKLQIEKQYELKSLETVGAEPRVQLKGEGTTTFNPVTGLPETKGFKGTLVHTSQNTTRRIPLTLTCRLMQGSEKGKALQPATPVRFEPQELTASELNETLQELKSSEWGRRQRAAHKLARAKPVTAKGAVVEGLVDGLTDANQFIRQTAAKALGVWGTTEAFEPLSKALDDPEFSVRWAAMEALAQLKDARAAMPLAKYLGRASDSMQAAQALIGLGAPAEDAVAAVLRENDREARREACRILKEIGTNKSVPALTAAATGGDSIVAMLASDALQTIAKRSSPNAPSQTHR